MKFRVGILSVAVISSLLAVLFFPIPSVDAVSSIPDVIVEKSYAFGDEVVELQGERTLTSKKTYLGEGYYAIDTSIGAIHYDDNGWQEIDNEFMPAIAPWDWEMTKAGYNVKVKEDFTSGQILEFGKQGSTVNLQPMALEWTNDLDMVQQVSMPQSASPTVTNPIVDLLPAVGMPSHQGTIAWDDAYGGGIDFEWKTTSTRLMKRLIISGLADLSPPEQYIQGGGNPVLRYNLIFAPSSDVEIFVNGELWNKSSKQQTFEVIEFRKEGEVLWGFMPLMYWDSTDNKGQSVATVEKSGQSLYISIRVPYEWLQSAVYPVYIDVDIDDQVEAHADDMHQRGTGDTSNDIYMNSRSSSSSYNQMWGGFRFDNMPYPPQGSTINACYFSMYVREVAYDDIYAYVHFEEVASPAVLSTGAGNFNISGRDITEASALWDDTALGVGWENSPSLVSALQEVVDAFSPTALTVITRPTSSPERYLKADAYDSDPTEAAKLHIEYTVLEVPDPPTNFVATENLNTKVTCTWTKSAGATKCQVYRDGNPIGGELGDVDTFDDNTAGAPTITPGNSVSTDGDHTDKVSLSLAGTGTNDGTQYTYKVRAGNADGWSSDSNADNGKRISGALTYQWQRSVADSDASYGNIDGATTLTYNDMAAPAPTITAGNTVATDGDFTNKVTLSLVGTSSNDGAGRWYKCVLSATGCTGQTSSSNRGYRDSDVLSYQWQRSAADSDANYGNIGGATGSTYDDVAAPAGIITSGTAIASDGGFSAYVVLAVVSESVADGAGRYYQCVLTAPDAVGQTATSNRGYQTTGAITYQWQRSAADSDAAYSALGGATTNPFNDTTTPVGAISNAGNVTAQDGNESAYVVLSLANEATVDGGGYWYYCEVNAIGAVTQDTNHNRGCRGVGVITYQWQMSDADSDVDYNTNLGITDPYNATEAPTNGDGRYFQCIVSAVDASNSPLTSDSDRGYKGLSTSAPPVSNSTALRLLHSVVVLAYSIIILTTVIKIGKESTIAALLFMAIAIYIGVAFVVAIEEAFRLPY